MDMANFALANYLAARGNEVHLVAHRVADALNSLPNVRVHQVSKLANSYMLSAPLLDHRGRASAAELKAKGGRVVVNGGNCQFGDINWVHYVHAAYEPHFGRRGMRSLKGRLAHQQALVQERSALQKARTVIVNSERTRQDVVERLGVCADRVHTVYYGIDARKFHPVTNGDRRKIVQEVFKLPMGQPVLAFVGALGDRRKGFDTLFEAWKILCTDRGWDANLVVIGAGGELSAWQARAALSRLDSRIRFLGFRGDVPALLAACDALVSPTRYEAYGLGVQEALCCGLPAFVSKSAGVAERYPPELRDLLISDSDNIDELVQRLKLWRERANEYRAALSVLSENLREHTWTHMAAEIVDAA
jgi:glycosyltransferase involved in cell wall biosynthesis